MVKFTSYSGIDPNQVLGDASHFGGSNFITGKHIGVGKLVHSRICLVNRVSCILCSINQSITHHGC